jgi:hypothetical protein
MTILKIYVIYRYYTAYIYVCNCVYINTYNIKILIKDINIIAYTFIDYIMSYNSNWFYKSLTEWHQNFKVKIK